MRPCGLEDREVGSFRNLTWLYTPYMLAGEDSLVRHKDMDWGWDMPVEDPHPHMPVEDPQWCVFHSRHCTFQQAWLTAGQWDPSEIE